MKFKDEALEYTVRFQNAFRKLGKEVHKFESGYEITPQEVDNLLILSCECTCQLQTLSHIMRGNKMPKVGEP